MINVLKKKLPFKYQASKFFSSILLTGGMLLFVLKPGVVKSNPQLKAELVEILKRHPVKDWKIIEAKEKQKAITIEIMPKDTIDALRFLKNKVNAYYPEFVQYVDSLLNNFWDQEHKDTVNYLFQQYIFSNIYDEQKQVASMIYCIENFVFKGKKANRFKNTYKIEAILAAEEFKYLFDFNEGYNKRFKGYYIRLEENLKEMNKKTEENKKRIQEEKKKIEEEKKKIEADKNQLEEKKKIEEDKKKIIEYDKQITKYNKQIETYNKQITTYDTQIEEDIQKLIMRKQQIEGIIDMFTIGHVKKNEHIKSLILEIEKRYILTGVEMSPHTVELIKVAKTK